MKVPYKHKLIRSNWLLGNKYEITCNDVTIQRLTCNIRDVDSRVKILNTNYASNIKGVVVNDVILFPEA